MSALTSFLKQKAEQIKNTSPERLRQVEEWVSAVAGLFDLLEKWLKEADSEGILKTKRVSRTVSSEQLGSYTVSSLEIVLDGEKIAVVPVARHVLASIPLRDPDRTLRSQGRVDFKRHGDTVYVLYRVEENGQDSWYFASPGGGRLDLGADYDRVTILSRESFEAAILGLLR